MNDTRLIGVFGMDMELVYHFLDQGSNWKCLSDIAREMDENKMTVRRSLENMTSNHIIEERNDGYRRFFRLKASHITPALRTLKNLDSEFLWAVVRRLRKKADVLLLYGSRADGTNEPDSDWDILAISDDLDPLELNRLSNKLEKRLGQVLNLSLYSKVQMRKMRNENAPFYKEISKKKVPLVGDLDDI